MYVKSCLYTLVWNNEKKGVAMLKLYKNLAHNFVLYEPLNLLVYFETWAWNKTLWEANAYDQT
jgi:hypothetical protein